MGMAGQARIAEKFNQENKHVRVLLGGSCFLNTASFLESIAARAAVLQPPS